MVAMTEAELHELLQALNYCGRASSLQLLSGALISGPPNMLFYDVVTWLGTQLGLLLKLENRLTVDADYLNSSSVGSTLSEPLGFMVEMSSLLKELRCPIKQLTSGSVEERLFDVESKTRVIEYLIQELLSAKVIASKNPQETPLKIELSESKTAKELKEMLVSLSFSKPPEDITSQRLFREVEKRITTLSQPLLPTEIMSELLFRGTLTEKQWFQLESLHADFCSEYSNRRNLELKRTELTVQSFLWSDRFKKMADTITNKYNERRREIVVDPAVNLSDVLSTTADLNVTEKTSSGSARKNTQSAVNKVRIGNVPDRGGRPSEQQPPPPEVPSWQKNDSSSRGGGGGGYRQQPSNNPRPNFQQQNQYSDRNQSQNHFSDNRSDRGYHQNHFSDRGDRGYGGRGGDRPHFQQRGGHMAPPRMQTPAGDNFAAYGGNAAPNDMYGQQRGNRRGRGGGSRGRGGGHGSGGGYGGSGGYGGGGGGFGGFGGQGQYGY